MITVQRISDSNKDTIAINVIIDTHASLIAFKELVQRATNLWPDATPEIKEFADLITEGRILQDYRSQDTSPSGKTVKRNRVYTITRIIVSASRAVMTIMCSCGVSKEVPEETTTYVCSNCNTTHNVREYVK